MRILGQDEDGMTLVSKRLKVSNETVDATGYTRVCYQPRERKANVPGSTAKIGHFGPPGRWIVPCSDA